MFLSLTKNTVNMHQQTFSSSTGSSTFSYGPQLGLDIEFGSDPASGAIFNTDGRKHDDLKQMLDSNKDGLKLEAMKRLIGMIARGRDASELFPAVVKNVVSKNIEVKKLVYVYLVRYAEEQQDLALLSISTFQRALKDPNQLIRASALRVLSSIRVSMIVPIVMLAIRESASDMSPYVRKTAAHAIPKLYSLDPEQKDELVTVIEKLLSDRTTLVVGSAVMAFDEVCPERVDLIHKNYRKLCNLLVDVDEWGQVIIINMLTRYARTQFVDPNGDDEECFSETVHNTDNKKDNFYEDNTTSQSSDEENSNKKIEKKSVSSPKKNVSSPLTYHVDLDHRLLLRQAKPLLQSRNASVVMGVAQLYHHIAPRNEVQLIAKALIRLLRSHKEVQSVVLTCIASISMKRKSIFESHIKTFFVRTSDPTHIKLLKLDILTNLASGSSISLILREFQTYISSSDRSFVAATIQAIGRCAASIKDVTETCLSGLVHLLSNRDEYVVAESVVVIKRLLQTKAAQHFEIISQMAKLLDFINVPAARASILWLIGEYNKKVPKIAPDVLRKLAKTFVDEEDIVKLQVLNLGVKLYLTNPEQTSLLCQYVFTLARYDSNYDVRDRARLLRQFIFPTNSNTVLSRNALKIFLSSKPAPSLESKYRDRDHFQLGSLSHYLNMRATGYNNLPNFPAVAPDSSVRNVEGFQPQDTVGMKTLQSGNYASNALKTLEKKSLENKEKCFLSESSKSSDNRSADSSDTESTSSASESASDTESNIDQLGTTESGCLTNTNQPIKQSAMETKPPLIDSNGNNEHESDTSDSESSSYESSDTNTESESSESSEENIKNNRLIEKKLKTNDVAKQNKDRSNLDLLLDLDDIPPIGPIMTPSLGGFLTPGNYTTGLHPQNTLNRIELVGPSFIDLNYKELFNKLSGHGICVSYRFTRSPHLYSSTMVSVELKFVNQSTEEITDIQIGQKTLPSGMNLNDFAPIQMLQPQQTITSILGIDFNDSTHTVEFEITSSMGISRASLKPPVGELIRSVHISETYFKEERTKLRGMNEHQSNITLKKNDVELPTLRQKMFECMNVASISTQSEWYFVGQTMSSKSLVLICLDWNGSEDSLTFTVNCEKMVIGSMILNELRSGLNSLLKC